VLLEIAECVKVESREGLVLRPEPLQSFPDPVQRYDEAELGEIRADHLLGIFAAMNQTKSRAAANARVRISSLRACMRTTRISAHVNGTI
jgi:hypothetical protein